MLPVAFQRGAVQAFLVERAPQVVPAHRVVLASVLPVVPGLPAARRPGVGRAADSLARPQPAVHSAAVAAVVQAAVAQMRSTQSN